jgi:glucose/mannose-6-phosphate isomerase
MEDAIKNFSKQFSFEPVIENAHRLREADSFVIGGMGGSNLATGILKIINPALDMYVHRDYGLPALSEKRFGDALYIASSYSGNTEEVLNFAEMALENAYNLAIIATGGRLIEFAKAHGLPHIVLPQSGMQPRSAVGVSLLALAKLMGDDEDVVEIQNRGQKLVSEATKETGEVLAKRLKNKIPVVYSSRKNLPVAYNWKIKFNETAKIPAFYNHVPELNHNEMTGFDVIDSTKKLSENFHFIFISDPSDEPKIIKRMEVMAKLFEDRGLPVKQIEYSGETYFEKVFNSLLLADWTALALSKQYGTEPEQVPMVEEFKKLVS